MSSPVAVGRIGKQLRTGWHKALGFTLELQRQQRPEDETRPPPWGSTELTPQTNVAFSLLRSTCPRPSLCSRCLLALTIEGRSDVRYTADLVRPPRPHSSSATPSHFFSGSELWEPLGSREPLRVRLAPSTLTVAAMLSKSSAGLGLKRLDRDEGDLDLRRERRGGRGGGGEGAGGLTDVVLLLKAPPPLSLPLCLSLPEEEEEAWRETEHHNPPPATSRNQPHAKKAHWQHSKPVSSEVRRSVADLLVKLLLVQWWILSHPARHGWRASEQLASRNDLFSLTHPAPQTATNSAQPEWGTRITSVWVEVLRGDAG